MILSEKDFVGNYLVAADKYTQLESYIHKYENEYIKKILGTKMYPKFIASLVFESTDEHGNTIEVPGDIDFKKIFYEFTDDENNIDCIGLKNCLRNFVFFFFTRDLPKQKTSVGTRKNKSELNEDTDYNESLKEIYNEGVNNAKVIQNFVHNETSSFVSVKRSTVTMLNEELADYLNTNVTTYITYNSTEDEVLLAQRKFTSIEQLLILVSEKLNTVLDDYGFAYQKENTQAVLIVETEEEVPFNVLKIKFVISEVVQKEYEFSSFTNTEDVFELYNGQQLEYVTF